MRKINKDKDIEIGTLLLHKGSNTFLGLAVKILTLSKYSHSVLKIGKNKYIESDKKFKGVRILNFKEMKNYNGENSFDLFKLKRKLNKKQEKEIERIGKKKIGKSYNFFGGLLLFFNIQSSFNGYFCTELITEIMNEITNSKKKNTTPAGQIKQFWK